MSAVPKLRLLTSAQTSPQQTSFGRLHGFPGVEERAPRADRAPVVFYDAKSTELMRRFQNSGDGESFNMIYNLNAPRIERIVKSCLRYGARDIDASEIVQDVFVSIFRSAGHFRPERENAFRFWSSQIARNSVRKALRDRRACREQSSDLMMETLATRPNVAEEGEALNSGTLAFPVLLLALAAAMEKLLLRDFAVLVESEILEMDYLEIARRHNLRPGTVRMVVFRARHRLFAKTESLLFRGGSRVK
ncbi:MAG: RNA polymerase sigma factor [Planctomycetota bacterium]